VRAEVLSIGDELLRGEILDSNKSFLSQRLLDIDIETRFHASMGDDPADMSDAFRRAVGRSDVVLVSGGLGPTRDDLTAEVLAQCFERKLVLDTPSLEIIRAFFDRIGREMSENNAKQAYFPERAEILPNPIGTAPGFAIEEHGTLIFCMPGVPRELHRMMDDEVLPRLAARGAAAEGRSAVARATLLRTFGMGESTLDAELQDLDLGEGVELGFRTSFPDNFLRPVARAGDAAEAERRLARAVAAIRRRLGALVYGEGEEPMEAVLGELLRERQLTIATAESCTGGLIAQKLTDIPGSSEYFLGGVVAYSNAVKTSMLGVSEALLAEHGAVSEPVAAAMADGARKHFGADLAVSTTGISGPAGGTETKPVGLVALALARAGGTYTESFTFPLDRTRHRALTAQVALDWLRRELLGVELIGPTLMRRQGGGPPPAAGPLPPARPSHPKHPKGSS